jgi:hypothetical protein
MRVADANRAEIYISYENYMPLGKGRATPLKVCLCNHAGCQPIRTQWLSRIMQISWIGEA